MKKILSAQALMNNGKIVYSGLFDEDGNPVDVELESEDGCVLMSVIADVDDDDYDYEDECLCEICRRRRDGEALTEEEIDDYGGCPLYDHYSSEGGI